MKKLVRQSKILGAMALTAFAFMFIACGGDARSKAESYIKEKYPDAKILSFSEIQKEFGLKDKECLVKNGDFLTHTYVFIEENGKFEILDVETRNDKGISKIGTTYSNDNGINTLEYFKSKNAECFN